MRSTLCLARCLRGWRCWSQSMRCRWTHRADPCRTYGRRGEQQGWRAGDEGARERCPGGERLQPRWQQQQAHSTAAAGRRRHCCSSRKKDVDQRQWQRGRVEVLTKAHDVHLNRSTHCLARCLRGWRCWKQSMRCQWMHRADPCRTFG
jgi:hypothetical protein